MTENTMPRDLACSGPPIAIETAGVVVRAECGVDVGWLMDVLRAVKGRS
jgi:hypothetical protein